MIIVVHVYLKGDDVKVLKFHLNNSPYFENKQLPLFSGAHQSQPAITCPKLTIETLKQGVKYVQS